MVRVLTTLVDRLIDFAERLNLITFRPYQQKRAEEIFANLIEHETSTFTSCYSRKGGKALAVTTLIPTPDGWVTMGSLQQTDVVYDEYERKCKIVLVSEIMYNHDCYELTFSNNSKIIADQDHYWRVVVGKMARSKELLTTLQIKVALLDKDVVAIWPSPCTVKSVRKVKSVPVKCIRVDSPSGLFLAGKGKIPTHNSELSRCITTAALIGFPLIANSSHAKDFPHLKTFRNGFRVGISGPKLNTAKSIFLRIKRCSKQRAFIDSLAQLNLSVIACNSETFELSNGSVASAFSGSPTASVEEDSVDLLILDESQRLSSYSVYKILRPLVAATAGIIFEIGTPGLHRCPFLRDIQFNQRKHPELDQQIPYEEVMKYSESYRRFIDSELERIPGGKNNDFFRMNFGLEWLIAEGHLLTPEMFELMRGNYPRGLRNGGRLFAGIDWGKTISRTVVTILEDRNPFASIVDWLELQGDSYEDQYGYIVPFLQKYGFPITYSEYKGTGEPATDRMQHIIGKSKIRAKDPNAVYNDRILTNLSSYCKSAQIQYPDDDSLESKRFEEEMLDAEKEMKGDFLTIHKPTDQDEFPVGDDYVRSLALALDAVLSEKSSGKIEFRSTGEKRKGIDIISDF